MYVEGIPWLWDMGHHQKIKWVKNGGGVNVMGCFLLNQLNHWVFVYRMVNGVNEKMFLYVETIKSPPGQGREEDHKVPGGQGGVFVAMPPINEDDPLGGVGDGEIIQDILGHHFFFPGQGKPGLPTPGKAP